MRSAAPGCIALFRKSVAVLAVGALASAALSSNAGATVTGSTKFIPTFLVYYGGGPQLTAADAPKLAKYDLLDVDRFRYADINGSTWAAIKNYNPSIQIYLYEMGSESQNYMDSDAQVSLNGVGRYNVSRGHPMGSLNGNHPELFQLNSSGQRIYSNAYSNPGANQYWYLMDFGSSAYQSYWATSVQADIANQPWAADGVFADNCLTFSAAGGYSTASAKYPSDSAWSSAMNSFASGAAAALHGFGQKLWCNKGSTNLPGGPAAWQALDASANHPDVLLEEGAFAVEWGAAVQFYPEASWKAQVDVLGSIVNSKVALMSHTQLSPGGTGTDNWGKPVTFWQALWYSIGSLLIGKNAQLNNSYLMFSGGSGYDQIWYYDEYDKINLGQPVGPYAITNVGGVNIYYREFANGYVAVNPTATDVAALTLPQPCQQLTHDNLSSPLSSLPIVSAVAVKGHNAVIVLKAGSPPPGGGGGADTTPPSVPTGLTGTAISSTQANLVWNASTDNVAVTGYYVYLNNNILTQTTATSFTHSGLTAGTTYSYRVSSYDAAGNNSAWTNAVSVTTPAWTAPDKTAPTAPTALTAKAISTSQINLSWSASTDNVGVVGYRVIRSGTLVGVLAASPTSLQDTGLRRGTTYTYTVKAVDAAGNVSAGATVKATTPWQ